MFTEVFCLSQDHYKSDEQFSVQNDRAHMSLQLKCKLSKVQSKSSFLLYERNNLYLLSLEYKIENPNL